MKLLRFIPWNLCLILLLFSSCKEKHLPTILSEELIWEGEMQGVQLETYKIVYLSDSLKIEGFINKPVEGTFPAILFCRGGNRDYGAIEEHSLNVQRRMASNGFVVCSSQLRGNKYSEGVDEFGGGDVLDILELVEIAKNKAYVFPKKVGVWGFSRGGLNAYQVSRLSDDIEAIAVIGGLVDLRASARARPALYEQVYRELIGDSIPYAKAYDYRSPTKWCQEIDEPVLVLHGANDRRVSVKEVEIFIKKLQKVNPEVKHKIFATGGHSLSSFRNERDSLLVDWFNYYLR